MGEIYENSLPSKTNIATNDLIRLIGSNNASYKALVSDVAKCIVENYTGSNIAGSSQSIKAALDALNRDTMGYFPLTKIPSGTNLNAIFYGSYFCNEHALDATITNKPSGASTIWRLYVTSITRDGYGSPSAESAWIKRIQTFVDEGGNTFIRKISKGESSSATVFGDWIKQPTRAEVDALNSRLWKHIEMGDHRTLTLHFATGFVSLFVYGTGSGMTPFMAAITASPDESSILVNPTTRNITVSGNRSSVVVTFPASWYNTWFSSDYEFTYEIS